MRASGQIHWNLSFFFVFSGGSDQSERDDPGLGQRHRRAALQRHRWERQHQYFWISTSVSDSPSCKKSGLCNVGNDSGHDLITSGWSILCRVCSCPAKNHQSCDPAAATPTHTGFQFKKPVYQRALQSPDSTGGCCVSCSLIRALLELWTANKS